MSVEILIRYESLKIRILPQVWLSCLHVLYILLPPTLNESFRHLVFLIRASLGFHWCNKGVQVFEKKISLAGVQRLPDAPGICYSAVLTCHPYLFNSLKVVRYTMPNSPFSCLIPNSLPVCKMPCFPAPMWAVTRFFNTGFKRSDSFSNKFRSLKLFLSWLNALLVVQHAGLFIASLNIGIYWNLT